MSKSFDFIAASKSTASAIFAGANALEIINTQAKGFREAGIKFGKSVKTCLYRAALNDAMATTFKGKAAKTYANYVTSFVGAVNDNVPFSFSASKGKAKGGKKEKSAPEFSALLAKVFSHPDFVSVFKNIQSDFETKYENAEEPHIINLVRDYLESEGFEITE